MPMNNLQMLVSRFAGAALPQGKTTGKGQEA
jgi:hypothetical protein